MPTQINSDINKLILLIETLRGENGCPWDKQQTPKTMVLYLIEEAYELLDAIGSETPDRIHEELGDVLFQVFFIARLYQEMGHFDVHAVAGKSVAKMIHRHPHVFSEKQIDTAEDVKRQWHEIKREEKNDDRAVSILDSIPTQLPALMRAYRISDRAARSGFDWEEISGVLEKVEEEWGEFRDALAQSENPDNTRDNVAMEFGDILFTLVNVARFSHIHPESALTGSIKKFEKRFKHMESILSAEGKAIESVSYDELNQRWETAKKETTAL